MSSRPSLTSAAVLGIVLVLACGTRARAQTVNDVLSFLLTNRSVPTDDFVRDAQAADTTRATIARFLQVELGTVPIATSASGFTYRINPTLGVVERSSDSFGPFFADRSLTLGRRQLAVSLGYHEATYDALDGRPLNDGTLVSTATRLTADRVPFDVETLRLRVRTRTTVASAHVGVTDRLDVGVTLPFVELSLDGERTDNYRGTVSLQARATAVASGLGDALVRGKYNAWRAGGGGLAVAIEGRLPTGDAENLLGAGQVTVTPRAIGSFERSRVAVHGTAGYVIGGDTRELNFGTAMTVVAASRLTFVAELAGRRLEGLGRLVDSTLPHPTLIGVETVRLTSTDQPARHLVATAGFKWNVASTWLLSTHLSRSLTDSGLTTGWVPAVTLDYLVAGW